ncbi:MAG: GIY-YIG nuclease family protein [Bacteroidota bacterium]
MRSFFVYIITNPKKTVLYIGITNGLESRIISLGGTIAIS